MRVEVETEHVLSATRRYRFRVETAQTDRNYWYMEYRKAVNFPLTPGYEVAETNCFLLFADFRLSKLQETGPRRLRRFVLGRVRIPLPSIPVSAMAARAPV